MDLVSMYIYPMDMNIIQNISHYRNIIMDSLAPIIRNKTTWIPLYLYLIYYFWTHYHSKFWKIIFISVLSILISDTICSQILKPYFHRIRPCQMAFGQQLFLQFSTLCSHTGSFPSSHAANHSVIAYLWSKIISSVRSTIFFIIWVAMICFSQLYIGVHYFSDIIGGIVIGLVLGKIVYQISKNKLEL